MIDFVKGDLLASQDNVLVNTVNTVGVMGKGVALQFKDEFPYNYRIYVDACKRRELYPGKLLIVKDFSLRYGSKIIVNFPTKIHWRNPSEYEYIETGLVALREYLSRERVESISIPPLGCGNGGLDWERVKHLIIANLEDLDVRIHVYEPNLKVTNLLKQTAVPIGHIELTPARAMMLYALFYYESLGEPSNLFVANKLVYFMQRLGEPVFGKLKFRAASFGPYCHRVGKDLHELNGKYLTGLEQMNLRAFDSFELQYDTLAEVKSYVNSQLPPQSRVRLNQLVSLITGFQSTFSLEVLASVDYVRKENPGISLDDTVQKVWEWSERKRHLFKERYIQIAYEHLDSIEGKLL